MTCLGWPLLGDEEFPKAMRHSNRATENDEQEAGGIGKERVFYEHTTISQVRENSTFQWNDSSWINEWL